MGKYVNPNNESFKDTINSEIYVDKSGLIEKLNKMLFTELSTEYATVELSECTTLGMALAQINNSLGIRFIIIIDEWDTIFREEKRMSSCRMSTLVY